jgi:Undecaprenyl-phosphate glucose phosphotransferase
MAETRSTRRADTTRTRPDLRRPTLLSAASGRAPSQTAAPWRVVLPQRRTNLVRAGFAVAATVADAAAIVLSGLATALVYHGALYGDAADLDFYLRVGFVIAFFFVIPNIYRNEYSISNYLSLKDRLGRSLVLWNVAFVSALALGFVTKTTEIFSRGSIVLFYVVGWGVVVLVRAIMVAGVRRNSSQGAVSAPRVFLVGFEEQVAAFSRLYQPWNVGVHVVAAVILRRSEETLEDDLALASASARMLRPDDVFLLVPWSEKATIDACLDAFLQVPASIHLGPERVLDRFMDAHISKIGPIASLQLVRRPLSTTEIVVKRLFDVAVAAAALILLSPLFLAVAVLIKLDSPGPVLFLQRRYGFNQASFRIVKFRSMKVLEDGGVIRQAARDDVRITRVGRWLRRWNLDELPQLLNVLSGDMSLVGPRPHALAHNQLYDRKIALYARRHNVRPGITGWAQVNGFRGETSTDDMMRSRVEHDLYYIDNWSLWLDLRILALTLFSPKAYRNAV